MTIPFFIFSCNLISLVHFGHMMQNLQSDWLGAVVASFAFEEAREMEFQ